MRILIADDDLTSRTMLAAVLSQCGHDVVATTNGAEAWAVMQGPDSPRLAILDWMMPEMDGLEVCRRIREVETDWPPFILMLTARDDTRDIVAGLRAGADDYLAKPYHPEELRARVEVGARLVTLQGRLALQMHDLREALGQIKTLRGIVPICANCKKIRDDQGYWSQVEAYVSQHSEAEFSHGICPECMHTLYPNYFGPANETQQ